MGEDRQPRGSDASDATVTARLRWWLPLAACIALAALLRLPGLGARPLGGDEAVFSLIARQLAHGGGYEQVPPMHGPLHYVATAAIFRAFGESDGAARLLPALFGVALVAVPFAFQRPIGRPVAVVAALLLAVSPVLLYYSRYASADVELAFFTLAIALTLWRYLQAPHRALLYLLSALLALAVVTSEMALLSTAIFVAWLHYVVARDLFAQYRDRGAAAKEPTHYERLGLEPGASAKDVRLAYRGLIAETDDRRAAEALAAAYRALADPRRRDAYDRRLAARAVRATRAPVDAPEPGLLARAVLFASAGLIAAAWPFLRGLRERAGLRRLPEAAGPLLVMALLALPFYGPLVEWLPFVGDRGFPGQQPVYYLGQGFARQPGGELPVMFGTLAVLFAAAMLAGIAWRWHIWIICWATFYGIAFTLFSGFFTDGGGVWTGLWGTLDYWWRPEAQNTMRADSYYATLLPLYEFLPLAIAAAGALALVIRGAARERVIVLAAGASVALLAVAPPSAPVAGAHRADIALLVAPLAVLALRIPDLPKFFAFWAVAAFFACTRLDLKEPWLAVQVALPLTMSAACVVAEAVARVRVPALDVPRAPRVRLKLGAAAALATAAAAVVLAARVGVDVSSGTPGGSPADARVELLEPAVPSRDVRDVLAALRQADAASGAETPVVLDASDRFARSWLWYLRDRRDLKFEDMRKGYDLPAGAVAIVDARDRDQVRVAGAATAVDFTQEWIAGSSAPSPAALAEAVIFDRARDAAAVRALRGVAFFPQPAAVTAPARSDVLGARTGPAR